jgi:hypothetical protein
MKKKIIYGLLLAVAMVTATSSFVSCKDYEGDDYAALNEKYTSLEEALKWQQQEMQKYCLQTNCSTEHAKIWNVLNGVGEDKPGQTPIWKQIWANNTLILTALSWNKTQTDSITKLFGWNRNQSDSIRTLYNALLGWGDDWQNAMQELKKIANTVGNDSTKWNEAADFLNLKAAKIFHDKYLQGGQMEIKTLDDMIKGTEIVFDSVHRDVDNLLGTFKKQITGININGTYNPVFGTLSMPTNTTSNVLAAFYGAVDKDVTFPSCDGGYYVNNEALYDEDDFELIAANGGLPKDVTKKGLTISKADDNAGTLYVTVNPGNLDFEGTDFFLRQSGNTNEEVPVTLSPLKPSEKVLTFGYTRGTTIEKLADKGFYELQAKIEPEDVKDLKVNINLRDFKEPVKNLINDAKSLASEIKNNHTVSRGSIVSDLAQLAAKIYANSSDIAPRLAMQAEWQDTTGHRVVSSDFNIAAVAVSPLGFSTLPTFNFGQRQFIKYIDGRRIDQEIYDIITENLKLDLNIQLGINISNLEFPEPDPTAKYIVPIEVREFQLNGHTQTNGLYVQWNYDGKFELIACDDAGNPLTNPDGTYQTTGIYLVKDQYGNSLGSDSFYAIGNNVYLYNWNDDVNGFVYLDLTDYTYQLLLGISQQVNATLAGFNTQVPNINNIDKKIKEQVEKAINDMGINIAVSLSDYVNGYVARINKLITRLNGYGNKALDYLSDPNRFLQPILLSYDGNHKLTTISRSSLAPTAVKAGSVIALQPTTLTLETVAPAYKKHIAVSNVWAAGKSAKGGDDAAKALMKAANTGLSTEVLEGVHALGLMQVPADAAAGTVFELTYTALDYYGKIAGKKFYLVVK